MIIETKMIWCKFSDELFFFILSKVKNKDVANDILQNTFLKIHNNLSKLEKEEKVRAWIFQIVRNEIVNHFNDNSTNVERFNMEIPLPKYDHICCFDKFINDLPEIYKQVVGLVYIKGRKQKDVAKELEISLDNVKARIRRAKDFLRNKFNECCKYELDKNGKLFGESNCSICNAQ